MLDVEAFILVGGRSSRMGTDKSRLQFGGQTSVERIAAELRPITARISLVGPSRADFGPDLRIVPDTHQQWGALGGIHAAFGACISDWALIVACDLPFVTRDLCSRLLALSQEESPDAVVPIQPDGRPQPLRPRPAGSRNRDRPAASLRSLPFLQSSGPLRCGRPLPRKPTSDCHRAKTPGGRDRE